MEQAIIDILRVVHVPLILLAVYVVGWMILKILDWLP